MTCRTYSSRGKQLSGCVGYLYSLLIFINVPNVIHAKPVPARWRNPCEVNTSFLVSENVYVDITKENAQDLCVNIIKSTKFARHHAELILKQYVDKNIYGLEVGWRDAKDNSSKEEPNIYVKITLNEIVDTPLKVDASFRSKAFIQGTASHRLKWLPTIDQKEALKSDFTESVRYFYSILQHYGVGLEQINTDQILFDGRFFNEFRDVEDNMAQLLCTLQVTLNSLNVQPNLDVTRAVMAQSYRSVGGHSQRLIRNYLILRDYIEALNIMENVFETNADKYVQSFDSERTLSVAATTPHLTSPYEPKRSDTY